MPHLLMALAALSLTACDKPGDAAFGQKVRAYLLENPEVLEEVATKLQEKRQVAAREASTEALRKYRAQLERDPRDLVINPQGKVTVVEFYDYRCGYCKTAAPEIVKLIQENPDVRFVFKEMPIFGSVSDTAAKVALTPAGKQKGLELYSRWMAERALDEAGIDRHLRALGLDPAQVRKAAADPAIERHIADVRQLASALQIEGTPAFVVGETLIPGADLNALRAAITVAKAGDLKRPPAQTES
ncbi:DsbA family protein [Phenylobacterium sp.]|jgi:protein-disulfide isomerase|uniref:DsbA family protein n=1 Tax=Phenylobacterium sp. TaxID=1871053 RepID=UPI002F94595B